VDNEQSCQWLNFGDIKGETGSTIVAAQDQNWPQIIHIIQGSGLLGLDDWEATVYVSSSSLTIYLSRRTKFCYELYLNTGC
jgi:hypothetical protein